MQVGSGSGSLYRDALGRNSRKCNCVGDSRRMDQSSDHPYQGVYLPAVAAGRVRLNKTKSYLSVVSFAVDYHQLL